MRRLLVAIAFCCMTLLAACGGNGVDYAERFDELMPAHWLLDAQTGHIDGGNCKSTRCGELDRTYQLRSDASTAASEVAASLHKANCTSQRAGNGMTGECADVHVSMSFSTNSVTVAMTRQ